MNSPVAWLPKPLRNLFISGKPDRALRGEFGEKLAARYLRKHGYKILYRNFRGRTGGEIDIICRHADVLVFVEVKTRTREDFGRPLDAVDRDKRKRISRGALAWLRMLDDPDILFRFDVVEVLMRANEPPHIELIRNAFSLSEPYIY
ncbi:MAG: YraN family protein [Chthoniobacterales bacterium]